MGGWCCSMLGVGVGGLFREGFGVVFWIEGIGVLYVEWDVVESKVRDFWVWLGGGGGGVGGEGKSDFGWSV